jgi:hypothetical protein
MLWAGRICGLRARRRGDGATPHRDSFGCLLWYDVCRIRQGGGCGWLRMASRHYPMSTLPLTITANVHRRGAGGLGGKHVAFWWEIASGKRTMSQCQPCDALVRMLGAGKGFGCNPILLYWNGRR